VTAHLIIAPQLMAVFQVHGLMMSTITSAVLNLSLLLIFYPKFVSQFEYFKFFKNVIVFAVLAAITGSTANLFYVFESQLPKGSFYLLFNILTTVGISIAAFIASGYVLKVKAVSEVVDKVLRKLKLKK